MNECLRSAKKKMYGDVLSCSNERTSTSNHQQTPAVPRSHVGRNTRLGSFQSLSELSPQRTLLQRTWIWALSSTFVHFRLAYAMSPSTCLCRVFFGRCRAYIFPVVINFPIDVSAHARFLKIINEQRNDKAFLV